MWTQASREEGEYFSRFLFLIKWGVGGGAGGGVCTYLETLSAEEAHKLFVST